MVREDNDVVLGMYERLGYEYADVLTLGKRLMKMKNTEFIPADFDAPWPSAPAFALLVRAVVAGRARGCCFDGRRIAQQGDAILNLFIPITIISGWGLLPGVPAVLAFCLAAIVSACRACGMMRWLLVLSQVLLLLWQPMLWLSGESPPR